MRLLELVSSCVCSCGDVSGLTAGPPDGDLGISAAGGGLGNRGELGGSDIMGKRSERP